MRIRFDALQERRKNYWLGLSGMILALFTIIACLIQVL